MILLLLSPNSVPATAAFTARNKNSISNPTTFLILLLPSIVIEIVEVTIKLTRYDPTLLYFCLFLRLSWYITEASSPAPAAPAAPPPPIPKRALIEKMFPDMDDEEDDGVAVVAAAAAAEGMLFFCLRLKSDEAVS